MMKNILLKLRHSVDRDRLQFLQRLGRKRLRPLRVQALHLKRGAVEKLSFAEPLHPFTKIQIVHGVRSDDPCHRTQSFHIARDGAGESDWGMDRNIARTEAYYRHAMPEFETRHAQGL